MWPKLSSQDRNLTLPFVRISARGFEQTPGTKYRDFIFFDAGMVIFDLDWELFEKRIEALFAPNTFDRASFLSALSDTQLIFRWERGLIGPHEYAKGFEECLRRAEKAPGALESHRAHVYEIKEISSAIIGEPRRGVIEIARKLREHNYFTGILSNATPWHEADILEKAEIRKNFDLVIFSQDLGCAKPEEKIYQLAEELAMKAIAAKTKIPESELQLHFYFVDDTPANVRAALAHGWQARLIDTLKDESFWSSPELQTLCQKKQNLTFGFKATQRIERLMSCFFEEI